MRQAFVSLVVVGLVTACFHDQGGKAGGGGSVENTVPKKKWAGFATDPLAFLPQDSEIIFNLEMQQMRQSALWQRFQPLLAKQMGGATDYSAECGFDPLQTVKSVTLGMKMGPKDSFDGVFVIRGLDRDRTMACMQRVFAKEGRKVTIDGGYVMIPGKQPTDPAALVTFVDATTSVFAMGPLAQRARFEAALGAGVPLRKSPAFGALLNTVDTRQTMWVIINGNSKAFDSFAAMGMRPKAFTESLSLANGLSASGRARLESPAQATQLASTFSSQIGPFKAMVDELDIGSDGADLTLRVAMNQQQLDSLLQLAGGALGGSLIGP